MNFLEKLDYMMNKYNLNKHSFAKASGIPYTTVDGFYKKGFDGIRLSTLWKIAEYFNTTIDYFVKDNITDPNYDRSEERSPICDDEMSIVLMYRSLSQGDKETIRLLLQRLNDEIDDGV